MAIVHFHLYVLFFQIIMNSGSAGLNETLSRKKVGGNISDYHAGFASNDGFFSFKRQESSDSSSYDPRYMRKF